MEDETFTTLVEHIDRQDIVPNIVPKVVICLNLRLRQ